MKKKMFLTIVIFVCAIVSTQISFGQNSVTAFCSSLPQGAEVRDQQSFIINVSLLRYSFQTSGTPGSSYAEASISWLANFSGNFILMGSESNNSDAGTSKSGSFQISGPGLLRSVQGTVSCMARSGNGQAAIASAQVNW